MDASALEQRAVQERVAKAADTPERQEAVRAYIESPNSPVERAKAERAIGPDGLKAVDDALDLRDRNQRFIEENALVGAEARRVYGAKPGERGTYLRREYTSTEGEVYDHLMLLQGKGAKLPKNELKRDRWIVTWGKDSYRKFDTEAEAVAFRKALKAEARDQVEAKKDQAGRGQPVSGEPGSNAQIIAPLSPEARKQMGEVTDPAVILTRTIALQNLKIARFNTLKTFAENASLPGDTKPDALPARFAREPIPNDPTRYGPLAGRYVDRVLRAEIVGRFGEVETLDRVFDLVERATSLWKSGKTVLNPGSQAGNIIGNIAFLERSGVSLARPSDATHVRNGLRWSIAGPDSPDYALRVELARRGIGSSSSSIDADLVGALRSVDSIRAQSSRTLLMRAGSAIKNAPNRLWGLSDTIPKMAAVSKALAEGKTLDQAVAVVRESFPDYSRAWTGVVLSSRTRAARGFKAFFAPPFLNFLSESVRIGLGTAAKKPASLATGLAVLSGMATLFKQMAGITPEEERKVLAAAPDWMRAGSLAAPLFWSRDEDGNPMAVDLRYVLPLSKEVGDLFGTGDARQSGLSLINNPIFAPLEDLLTNRDRFFGDPITREGSSDTENWEQRLRYLFDAYAPSVLTKTTPLGRRPSTTYQAVTGKEDRFGDVPDVGRALLGDFAGIRLRPIDARKEMLKRVEDVKARLAEMERAMRAAHKRGDTAEVQRVGANIRALREEWRQRRDAAR